MDGKETWRIKKQKKESLQNTLNENTHKTKFTMPSSSQPASKLGGQKLSFSGRFPPSAFNLSGRSGLSQPTLERSRTSPSPCQEKPLPPQPAAKNPGKPAGLKQIEGSEILDMDTGYSIQSSNLNLPTVHLLRTSDHYGCKGSTDCLLFKKDGVKPIHAAPEPKFVCGSSGYHHEHTASCMFPVHREFKSCELSTEPALRLEEDREEPENSSEVPNEPAVEHDKPLYEGARITVKEHLYSILSYAQSENLTLSSISRLLALVEMHCPKENQCFRSTNKLFKSLENIDCGFKLSYYCSVCWGERKSKDDVCNSCEDPLRKIEYFVHFPLAPQVSKLFKRPDFVTAIKYKYNRVKKVGENYEDIYDGEVYKEAESTILGNSNNISLMWFADGVQIFESSPESLWVLNYTLNELPPEERFKPQNILIGGIWINSEKPHPNMFLKHTADDLLTLKEGFEVEINGNKECVKVICLCGTCDGPAKALFFNQKTHSGYYACPYCFIKGEKSKRTGDVLVFPFEEVFRARTEDNYYPLLEASIKTYRSVQEADEACKGVKGPTLLSHLMFSSMFSSTAVDSMHCVYMGLTKQFLHLWFSETYKNQKFSLYDYADEINELLMKLELPDFVQRLPVSVQKLVYWKASLLRNFLFHILLPLLKDYMDVPYYEHMVLFIDAVSTLNGRSVSETDILSADLKLAQFVEKFQTLYGLRHMSFNLHLLRHAGMTVKNLGPWHVTSCFSFEDINGKLVNLAHGSKHISMQIAKRMSYLTEMEIHIDSLPAGLAKLYCQTLRQKWRRLNITESVAHNAFVVGVYDKSLVYEEAVEELLSALYPDDTVLFLTFPKLYFNNQLYVAESYTRSSRVSSHVQYTLADGTFFGKILTFVKSVNSSTFFAYINRFEVMPFCENNPDNVKYMHRCIQSDIHNLVPVYALTSLCFKISVKNALYVSESLNDFERE